MNIPQQELDKFLEDFIDNEVLGLISILNAVDSTSDEEITSDPYSEKSPISAEKVQTYSELLRQAMQYTARYLNSIADKYQTDDADLNKLYYSLVEYVKALIQ
jgi:hypothetical protein